MNRKAEALLDPRTRAAGHLNPPGNLRCYRFLNSVTGEFTQGPFGILSAVNHLPILFGTSSFTAAGWAGSFYTKGMRSADYAEHFHTVEVDTTFYACPSVNLPETHRSRWGEGLTAEDMKKCVWIRPERVAQIEFLEWTESDHLRHSKFVGLREDKDPRCVVKEQTAGESRSETGDFR